MKETKRKKLEAAGWKVGSTAEFLDLTPEEEALVAMKLSLAANVKSRRESLKMTQQELAKQIGSSQSRVAKIESADKSVSIDLLIRSLASLGATRREIAGAIGGTLPASKQGSHRSRIRANKSKPTRRDNIGPVRARPKLG
jgi:transcriptional regulator with XRE-family HTH domain